MLLIILGVLSGHVLIVTDFLLLEAELLLHLLKCHLYLLELAVVDSLHLSLLTIDTITGPQPLFQEIELGAHFCCEVTDQGAILLGSLDLELHRVQQLLQLVVLLVQGQVLVALSLILLGELQVAFFDDLELLGQGRLGRSLILDCLLQGLDLLSIAYLSLRSLLVPTSCRLRHHRHCSTTVATARQAHSIAARSLALY